MLWIYCSRKNFAVDDLVKIVQWCPCDSTYCRIYPYSLFMKTDLNTNKCCIAVNEHITREKSKGVKTWFWAASVIIANWWWLQLTGKICRGVFIEPLSLHNTSKNYPCIRWPQGQCAEIWQEHSCRGGDAGVWPTRWLSWWSVEWRARLSSDDMSTWQIQVLINQRLCESSSAVWWRQWLWR